MSATPETIKKLVALGVQVGVETGAGAAARYPNSLYVEAGARVVTVPQALAADVVLAVRRPDGEQIAAMQPGALLVGFIDPYTGGLDTLAKGVSARCRWSACRAPPAPSPWTPCPPRATSPATGR